MKPQNRDVLELLQKRGDRGVTQLEALTAVGCFRLGARIWDLRSDGYEIESRLVASPGGKHIARYRLLDPPMQLDARL